MKRHSLGVRAENSGRAGAGPSESGTPSSPRPAPAASAMTESLLPALVQRRPGRASLVPSRSLVPSPPRLGGNECPFIRAL